MGITPISLMQRVQAARGRVSNSVVSGSNNAGLTPPKTIPGTPTPRDGAVVPEGAAPGVAAATPNPFSNMATTSMYDIPVGRFQQGGMVGPGGQPIQGGMPVQGGMQMQPVQVGMQMQQMPQIQQPQQPADPQMVQMQVQDAINKNPQAVAQVRQAIEQAMASGELTPQELTQAVELATLVLSNPSMYPQVRAFAIQNGLAGEEDLPMEYDQGLVIALLIAGKAMQSGGMQTFEFGGTVGGAPDSPVPIMAHQGEYVIPKEVVMRKGTDFFDKMVNPKQPK